MSIYGGKPKLRGLEEMEEKFSIGGPVGSNGEEPNSREELVGQGYKGKTRVCCSRKAGKKKKKKKKG